MIAKRVGERELAHVVCVNDKYYYVDSADTWDCGYETMAFPCDKSGEVLDWAEFVYRKNYDTKEEMERNHEYVINNLETILFSKGELNANNKSE